jgi:hypothetical protein
MRAVAQEGIDFTLARTWEGGRGDERRLKDRHDHPGLCPVCRGNEPQLDPRTKLVDVERDLGLAELRRTGEARRQELAHDQAAPASRWPSPEAGWGPTPEAGVERGWAR